MYVSCIHSWILNFKVCENLRGTLHGKLNFPTCLLLRQEKKRRWSPRIVFGESKSSWTAIVDALSLKGQHEEGSWEKETEGGAGVIHQ